MTYNAGEPAISGGCYTVVDIDGHRPAALDDFTGDAAMTLLLNGASAVGGLLNGIAALLNRLVAILG